MVRFIEAPKTYSDNDTGGGDLGLAAANAGKFTVTTLAEKGLLPPACEILP